MQSFSIFLKMAACILPIFVLAGILGLRVWLIDRRKERNPLADKLLRPAGESLRVRIDKIGEQLNQQLLIVAVSPFVISLVLLSTPTVSTGMVVMFATILVVGFTWVTRHTLRLANEFRSCRLGYHGELAVAEELNQLMLDGCRVFHDVPMEPYGNIDHVVVAASGVYAVETKTRRKRSAGTGVKDYEVTFDGKTLQFPHGTDSDALFQTRQQADRLRAMLLKCVGESVPVFPILTLPGWFVVLRARGDVRIMNPKSIRSVVKGKGLSPLSEALMTRVAYQLDQKCRDVAL